jgi:hypothetical protein
MKPSHEAIKTSLITKAFVMLALLIGGSVRSVSHAQTQEEVASPPTIEPAAEAPGELPQLPETNELPEGLPSMEAGRFTESLSGNAEPQYLSRETPLYQRFRQAMQTEQPTFGRPLTGSGRFGQRAQEYGEIEEGPGFMDVLFPELSRRLREGNGQEEDEVEAPEQPLPPTFFTRLNRLFLNQVLADATLPISIRNPGPDSANFPNSAYTLERGHIYIETQPLQVNGPTDAQAYTYSFGYLLRFGLTDRVEFRLFSNGLTYQAAFKGNKDTGVGPSPATTGAAPLYIDFKINFWEQRIRSLVPAMGMEVFMSTDTGSSNLQIGVAPTVNLLFDYNFGDGWNLEWNIGVQPANTNAPRLGQIYLQQFFAQWSLQKAITDDFAVFLHGYFNGASLPQYGGNTVLGVGGLYYLGDRWSLWGNYNLGLDRSSGPPFTYNFGFAYAF